MDEADNLLDRATSARLAKLRSMPIDVAHLKNPADRELSPVKMQWFRWTKPVRALAASLAIIGIIAAVLLGTSGGPVQASAAEMVQFHEDLVSGRVPVTQVDSMSAANRVLSAQWAGSPRMPDMPADHVMACCMRSVKNRKMACVLLHGSGEAVTMTVARSSDMKPPTSPIQMRNGVEFHVQTVGAVNMVMTQRDGRWVCLIARLPSDRLMDLASNLQF